jgi:O-antigen/teichoic acid export membrane protein
VVARAASILASFVLTLTVARLLGANSAGTFFVAFTSLAIFATLARFGTDNLALVLAGRPSQAAHADTARLLMICTFAGALSVALAILVFASVPQMLPGIDRLTGMLAASAIVPQALSVLAGAILRGRGRLAAGTMAELGSIPALTLLLLAGSATLSHPTLTTAVIALSLGSWLTAAWSVPAGLLSVRTLAADAQVGESATTNAEFLRRHVGRLARMMGTSVLFYALTWAPLFILAATRGTSDVAYYALAARLAAFIALVPSIQISYLAPAFARLYHSGELVALNALCSRSSWQATIVAAVPALAFVAVPYLVVSAFYGQGFAAAAIPLLLLSIGAFIGVVVGQVNQLMLLCEMEGSALALNAAWLGAWITVGLLLSDLAGAPAAAAFALGSGAIYAAVAAALLVSKRGIRSYAQLRWQRSVSGG